jgi:hypothetical protein
MVIEPTFAKEVMMPATMKHWNVIWFVGAYQKPLVWCIVTKFVKG